VYDRRVEQREELADVVGAAGDKSPQVDARRERGARTGEHDSRVRLVVERDERVADGGEELEVEGVDLPVRHPEDGDAVDVVALDHRHPFVTPSVTASPRWRRRRRGDRSGRR
jgi:hypothetical protein